MTSDRDQTRALWDALAADWQIQVGADGDANRRLNSDPVLWALLGDVAGRQVLDAGCGTGYLCRKLADAGARVTGIDFSSRMIDIARRNHPDLDFRVDSCAELATLTDGYFDALVSNYVLMDTPDLEATLNAFHRVLKPGGCAVLIFSHPCFPQGQATRSEDGDTVSYHWSSPYFARRKFIDPPWAHFKEHFIWFHRPLSDYWKAFTAAGFAVTDLEEPRNTSPPDPSPEVEHALKNSRTRPYSIAFKLQK